METEEQELRNNFTLAETKYWELVDAYQKTGTINDYNRMLAAFDDWNYEAGKLEYFNRHNYGTNKR